MYLEVAIGATALAYAAGPPPDLPTESLPVPGSPVLSVETLPALPLATRQRPLFSQPSTPEPDAKPHREHVHGI